MKIAARIVLCAACLFGIAAQAQEYPARPVTVIVPFSAGSASDVMARIVLERMGPSFGQRFIVDNRPAAGGNVGTAAAAKAAPDGYVILMGALGPLSANKTLYPNLGYDPEKDFAPISMYASMPNIVVVSSRLPPKSLAEFVDYVKKNADVPYGTVGNGSSQHLAAAYFEQLVGVKMTHVPYRVTAQLQSDLASGQVPVGFQLFPNIAGHVKSGAVRPLAVASDKRLAALPGVPTCAEAGVKGFDSAAWFGFLAPRGAPQAAVARLYREVVSAMADSGVRARFAELGAEPLATTPEAFARHISSEIAKWRAIIEKGGITADP